MPRKNQRVYRREFGPEREPLSDWVKIGETGKDDTDFSDRDAPYGLLEYAVASVSETGVEGKRVRTDVIDTRPLYGYLIKQAEDQDTVTIGVAGNATLAEETVTVTFDGTDYNLTRLIIGDEKIVDMYVTEQKTTHKYFFHVDATDGWLVQASDGTLQLLTVEVDDQTESVD